MKIPYKGKTKFCIRNLIVPTTNKTYVFNQKMRGLPGKIEKEKVQYEEKKKPMVRASIINLTVLVINACCNCSHRINTG